MSGYDPVFAERFAEQGRRDNEYRLACEFARGAGRDESETGRSTITLPRPLGLDRLRYALLRLPRGRRQHRQREKGGGPSASGAMWSR